VAARVRVRADEVLISLDLMDQLLSGLPTATCAPTGRTRSRQPMGLAIVEGWRGEILTYVRFGADGRIARFFPRDPAGSPGRRWNN
jgi:Ni,Fe-hydrogenase III large subunit